MEPAKVVEAVKEAAQSQAGFEGEWVFPFPSSLLFSSRPFLEVS